MKGSNKDDSEMDLPVGGEELSEIVGIKAARITEGILRSEIVEALPAAANLVEEGVLQLAAALTLADSRVSLEEIETIKKAATGRLGSLPTLSGNKVDEIVRLFRSPSSDISQIAKQVKRLLTGDEVESLVNLLFDVAMADGIFHPGEQDFIRNIHTLLNSDIKRFAQHIKACEILETTYRQETNYCTISRSLERENVSVYDFRRNSPIGILCPPVYLIDRLKKLKIETVGDLVGLHDSKLTMLVEEKFESGIARIALKHLKRLRIQAKNYTDREFSDEEIQTFQRIIKDSELTQAQLNLSIHEFAPARRLARGLSRSRVVTVCDLLMLNVAEFGNHKRIGQKTLEDLRLFRNHVLESVSASKLFLDDHHALNSNEERFSKIEFELSPEQLNSPLADLDPPPVLLTSLRRANVSTVGDLLNLGETQFASLKGVGPKKVKAFNNFRSKAFSALSELPVSVPPLDVDTGDSSILDGVDLSLPIEVFDPPPVLLTSLIRANVSTVGDLLNLGETQFASLKGVGPKKVKAFNNFRSKAFSALSELPVSVPPLDVDTGDSSILDGVDLSLPIELFDPPPLLSAILHREGVNTCSDLVGLTESDFSQLKGAGRKKTARFNHWRQTVLRAILEGRQGLSVLNGNVEEPIVGDVDDWILGLLAQLEEKEQKIITDRFLNQFTFQQIAEVEGVTREAVRQRESKALRRFNRKASNHSAHRFEEFSLEIERRKLIPLCEVGALLPDGVGFTNPDFLRLVLQTQEVSISFWKGFLTTFTGLEREKLLGEFKSRLRLLGQSQIPTGDAALIAVELGLTLSDEGLRQLLAAAWEIQEEHGVLNIPFLPIGLQMSETVRSLRRAVSLEEIDEHLLQIGDIDLYRKSAASKRSYLQGATDVFSYGHGLYLHRDNLQICESEILDIVEFSLWYLRRDRRQVSTKKLLEEYKKKHTIDGMITPHLLKDFLSREEDVLIFRGTLNVASRDAYEGVEHRQLEDHLEEVLISLGRPSTLDEVVDEIEKRVYYSRTSIYACLLSSNFVVRPRSGWFQHIETLGLTVDQRWAILEQAILLLQEAVDPVSAAALVDRLDSELVKGLDDPATVVFALCGSDERFETASGQLIAAATQGESHLLSQMVDNLLHSLGVAFPRDLLQELRSEGFRGSDQNVRAVLKRGVEEGRIGNLPGSAYYLLGDPEDVLKRWRRRREIIYDASRHSDIEQVSAELAWSIVRFVVGECVPNPELVRQFLKRADLDSFLREAATKALQQFENPAVVEPNGTSKNVDVLFGLLTGSQ